MVAEGVEPHPACVAADQVAPHRRAVCPLRGAGVPALRHRCPQRVQQLVIQRGDFLLGVAPVDAAVCVIPVSGAIGVPLIIPLFQKIEVVRLARRVYHLPSAGPSAPSRQGPILSAASPSAAREYCFAETFSFLSLLSVSVLPLPKAGPLHLLTQSRAVLFRNSKKSYSIHPCACL